MIFAHHHQSVEQHAGTSPAALSGPIPRDAWASTSANAGTQAAGSPVVLPGVAVSMVRGPAIEPATGLPLASRAILVPSPAFLPEGFKKAVGRAVGGLDGKSGACIRPTPRVLPAGLESIAALDRSIFSKTSFSERYIRPRKRLLSELSDVFLIAAALFLAAAVVLHLLGD